MRIRERGVGNMAFIAVLVLLVVAAAMAFVWKDEADSNLADFQRVTGEKTELEQKLAKAGLAYDVWNDILGVEAIKTKTLRTGSDYPEPATIRTAGTDWILAQQTELTKAAVATVFARQWTISGDDIKKVKTGDKTDIQYYNNTMAPETATVYGLVTPIARAFRTACKHVQENNKEAEAQHDATAAAVVEKTTAAETAERQYKDQLTAANNAKESADTQRKGYEDEVTRLTGEVDGLKGNVETLKSEKDKVTRDKDREIRALLDRVINEKNRKKTALAEDPKDGEVVGANPRNRTCTIGLGRTRKVRRGMEFTVWRAGKGDRRENLAVIRVLDVKRDISHCSIVKILDSRIPVGKGHNISNPFYSPTETLTVYISGSLTRYDTATAAARLARHGVRISRVLDDRVQIIVLGQPDVSEASGGEEVDTDDADAVKALRAKEDALRERRLNEVIEKARAIGAVVVTENVLSTFIDW